MIDSISSHLPVYFVAGYAPSITSFDDWMSLQGEVFRSVKDRQTHKIILDGESVFIKKHYGVGWVEILKNLLSLKWPVLGARNEWLAIQKLDEIGIPTTPLLAYGERGCNPARRQSFIVTRDLGDILTLEDLCKTWSSAPPDVTFKRQLIDAVAKLAKQFHAHGMWHRDFYLCHFALSSAAMQRGDWQLYLMDLHRVEIYSQIPAAMRMKDLAGLYFSALHIGLTKRDVLRFLKVYSDESLSKLLQQQTWLNSISVRASQLDKKLQRKIAAGVAL